MAENRERGLYQCLGDRGENTWKSLSEEDGLSGLSLGFQADPGVSEELTLHRSTQVSEFMNYTLR